MTRFALALAVGLLAAYPSAQIARPVNKPNVVLLIMDDVGYGDYGSSGAIFGNRPTASGAMGGLFLAVLWMSIVSQLLFYGAELCKVIVSRDRASTSPALTLP